MKRTFDIVISFLALIILCPLLLIVSILIKMTMPGPVFFTHTRLGFQGLPFKIYKFRSMKVNNSDISVTIANDSRITPLGQILRKSKIDELPQLWNILIGEMSFVGPRPDVPGYADQLTGEDRLILNVKPGLTGADSIAFPDEEAILDKESNPERYYNKVLWPEKVRINLWYVNHRTIGLDLKIIGYTLLILLGLMNAKDISKKH